MGIKKNICKFIGETFLEKELYEYKKDIKEEIEKKYKSEIEELKKIIQEKQNLVDTLLRESKEIKDNKQLDKSLDCSKELKTEYPRNMID